jgi:hypothetical protein
MSKPKRKTNEELEAGWQRRRKRLPQATLRKVYAEAGFKCANPRCLVLLLLEAHHILWVKDGGGDEPENLLALCPNCHTRHTRGEIPYEAIWHWKAMLVSLNSFFACGSSKAAGRSAIRGMASLVMRRSSLPI